MGEDRAKQKGIDVSQRGTKAKRLGESMRGKERESIQLVE